MDYSFTENDIRKYLPDVNIIKYAEIRQFNSLNKLLHFGPVIVLVELKHNYGHWICLFQNKEGINYFDSYGSLPDEMMFIRAVRSQWGQEHKFLLDLVANSRYGINYNDTKLQKLKTTPFYGDSIPISTCGRWVICRLLNMSLTCDEFVRNVKIAAGEQEYDEWISNFIKIP